MQSNTTCGPLGFPMTDDQARATEFLMKNAAGAYQHATIVGKALETRNRTDISWITTETADRYNHVVLADGMDDTAYALNPIVTDNHQYDIPPVGRSLWRIPARRAGTKGIQAMTHYPERPKNYSGDWAPDTIFAQIVAGLLNAKSIGFIPLEIVEPQNPDHPLLIKRWALIEYAVGYIPINPETTVITINKMQPAPPPLVACPPPDLVVSINAAFNAIDAAKIIQNVLDKLNGRV